MSRAARARLLAAGLAALAVAACMPGQSRADPPVAADTCVTYTAGPATSGFSIVPCDGPHTHVVVTWIRDGGDGEANCPPGVDVTFHHLDGTYCLRVADSSPASPDAAPAS